MPVIEYGPTGTAIGTGASSRTVQGTAADLGTPTGNPVWGGAQVDTSPASTTNGLMVGFRMNARRALYVNIMDASGIPFAMASALADGAAFTNSVPTTSILRVWNGATYDRVRETAPVKVAVSAGSTSAGAYDAGDVIGGLMTFTGITPEAAGNVCLKSVAVHCLTVQTFVADLYLFDANPTASTFTNNAAISVHDDDVAKLVRIVPITRWVSGVASSVAQADFEEHIKLASGTAVYAALVTRDAPTLGSVADVSVSLRGFNY